MIEKLRILHVNDLHSHFENYPKIKRFFEQERQTDRQVLAFDIGDNVDKSHPLSAATAGRENVRLMNALGIDYATIGNNEGIGLNKEELNHLYDEADFVTLVHNLRDEKGQPSWAEPYVIYRTDKGTKIALLAYTFPYFLTYAPNGWIVEDALEVLRRDLMVSEVEQADFRILLSHLGVRVDERIAREIPQVDLIIGAHTHHIFEEGEVVNGTYLAAAGKYGQYVGEIDLDFDEHVLQDIAIKTYPTSEMPTQKKDQAFIEELRQRGRHLLAQHDVYHSPVYLDSQKSFDLVLQAVRTVTHSDVTLLNSGLVVAPFGYHITRDTLHESLPHQMRLVRLEVTGQELLDICRDVFSQAKLLANQKIHGMGFRGKVFGQVKTSGFTYKNDKIVYNNKVIDETTQLTLVLVDQYYFASFFETIRSKKAELLFPDLLREVVEHYLKGDL